jgi:hypothetical protein
VERIYDLRARLNLQSPEDPGIDARIYSSVNPWTDKHMLLEHVRSVLRSGYVCRSPYLRGYTALLVGMSALKALSFKDIMDGRAFSQDRGDGTGRRRGTVNDDDELSLAAWTLDLLNQSIDPLISWNPKQACAHLAQGLFTVAYSLHTGKFLPCLIGQNYRICISYLPQRHLFVGL